MAFFSTNLTAFQEGDVTTVAGESFRIVTLSIGSLAAVPEHPELSEEQRDLLLQEAAQTDGKGAAVNNSGSNPNPQLEERLSECSRICAVNASAVQGDLDVEVFGRGRTDLCAALFAVKLEITTTTPATEFGGADCPKYNWRCFLCRSREHHSALCELPERSEEISENLLNARRSLTSTVDRIRALKEDLRRLDD
ncbi:unnamed protein product [Heligmosomoides polygyrus]|uniref:BAG domain-containing protein n=1 Tax=Heligmosomoides polygyrus TaxID=6339 RepID=A0A3P8CEE5_HELPZ|nr:unnamed protein product [Heligmosomoides polygyrus]